MESVKPGSQNNGDSLLLPSGNVGLEPESNRTLSTIAYDTIRNKVIL